jgi:pimeloyl-ACP methyl ester carboxylesterase
MVRSRLAMACLCALVGAQAGLLGAAGTAGAAEPAARVANAPVVFVHGYIYSGACPGTDATKVFATAMSMLRTQGYTGPTESVSYYACDKNGPSIQTSGTPGTYFSSGKHSNGGNTNATDVRHIAYQLAWYLHGKYTSKGQAVSLVGHSMGGLIMRWALYQVQAGNPLFPPQLLVQDAVTISTPHGGILDSTGNVTWCFGGIQCTQMKPGSAFLVELKAHGENPQGTGGTDWSALGSTKCDAMTAEQATDAGDVHKIVWDGASKPKCYAHTSYLTDTSTKVDMPLKVRHPGATAWSTMTGPHSLVMVANALKTAAW